MPTNFRSPRAALLSAFALALVACENAPSDGARASGPAPAADAAHSHVSGQHAVKCGCALPEVGHCGEYVEVDGKFVELELPASVDLGKMPFCGKEGLRAEVEGELRGGKVVSTKFALVK
jgi:hypothetical protein